MPSFKFHLVTVMGIFLAMALGIFIGSTTSEGVVVREQRMVIEKLENKNSELTSLVRDLQGLLAEKQQQMTLVQHWLENLAEAYWAANPVDKRAVLIYSGDLFSPRELGEYLLGDVVQGQVMLSYPQAAYASSLAHAIGAGREELLAPMPGVLPQGNLHQPDIILLALGPLEQYQELALLLVELFADEYGIPVVALGRSDWGNLADLSNNPAYASVSHLDSPFAPFCLAEILHGNLGHYGPTLQVLPGGGE